MANCDLNEQFLAFKQNRTENFFRTYTKCIVTIKYIYTFVTFGICYTAIIRMLVLEIILVYVYYFLENNKTHTHTLHIQRINVFFALKTENLFFEILKNLKNAFPLQMLILHNSVTIIQFNFVLFIYTQYIYSVNMASNRDYTRKVQATIWFQIHMLRILTNTAVVQLARENFMYIHISIATDLNKTVL